MGVSGGDDGERRSSWLVGMESIAGGKEGLDESQEQDSSWRDVDGFQLGDAPAAAWKDTHIPEAYG